MSPKSIRHLCYLVTLLALGSAGLAAYLAWTLPYHIEQESTDVQLVGHGQDQGQGREPTPLTAYQSLWGLDLQRPLYDPPPPKVVVEPPPPPPPLTVRLMGTFIEVNGSKAMLMTQDGGMELRSEGEKIGEATIQAIRPNSITVLYYGEEHTLEVQSN